MSQLEPPEREESDGTGVTDATDTPDGNEPQRLSILGDDATVAVPADASASEAAAVMAAVGAHLSDRERATAAAAAAREPAEHADRWVLADRMRSRGKRNWPRDVERGDEWKAAARSF